MERISNGLMVIAFIVASPLLIPCYFLGWIMEVLNDNNKVETLYIGVEKNNDYKK